MLLNLNSRHKVVAGSYCILMMTLPFDLPCPT
jgi:hypothetical protein